MKKIHSFDSALSASTRSESIDKDDTLEHIIERSSWEDKLDTQKTSIWDHLKDFVSYQKIITRNFTK